MALFHKVSSLVAVSSLLSFAPMSSSGLDYGVGVQDKEINSVETL
jgi:hypothetical protein